MHRHFDELLSDLRGSLVRMGGMAEAMIDKAIRSLLEHNAVRHDEVFREEQQVNNLHIEVDERAIQILALQHPVAADLRLVVMCSKIGGELERIADQAVNICQNTQALLGQPPLKPLIDIPLMADLARKMLRESLDAFVRQDAALAQQVLDSDDALDAFKDQIFRELLTYMMEDPRTIYRATRVQSIAKYIERIGDHATNVAEMVVFMAERTDIRHRGKLDEPTPNQQ